MNIISSPLPSPVTSATTSMDALQDALQLVEKKSWDALIDQVNATPSLASMVASSPWSNGSQGNLIMHEACKQQPSVGVIEALLQACPDAARTRGRWGYLPLHYACASGASHHVIEMLIDAYPAGARTRDDHEQILPLHLAAKWGASEAILLAIMTTHPEGALFRDASGKTPLDHAEKIPTELVKEQVTKTLKLAPILCAVSKSAKLRATAENEGRMKGMAEAHANHIQMEQATLRQELVDAKNVAKELRVKLATANAHVKVCNDRLEAVQRWVKSLGASMDSWSVGSSTDGIQSLSM